LGLAVLSRPERINALNLEMLQPLEEALLRWETDPGVACVVVRGEGERGFCAGGDVRTICEKLAEEGPAYGEAAFSAEYRIDHRIHGFQKPVVTLGHGAVMGAGLGLFVAGSLRILAPGGRFLALTGSAFGAEDACALGLADRIVAQRDWPEVEEQLAAGISPGTIAKQLAAEPAFAPLEARRERVRAIAQSDDFATAPAWRDAGSDPWFAQAEEGMRKACPTSLRIADEALRRGARASLADCFRQDLTLVVQCMARRNFTEGVRARLIDRDHEARWDPPELADVDPDEVRAHFEPPWPGAHPLAGLR
jgi:enoyl-CoA hydratase/carnithine racemase